MRSAPRFLVAATLVCGLVVVLPAAAQGETQRGTASGPWAHAYCDGSAAWIDALGGGVGAITGAGGNPPDPAKVKSALVRFFKTAVRSTRRFERRLRKAGDPDVPHGAEIAEALTEGLADTRRAFARARADAVALTTSDAAEVLAGADAARATLQEELTDVATAVDDTLRRFSSPALGRALRGEPACQAFLPPEATSTTTTPA